MIEQLIHSSDWPVLVALALGLMVALNPCQIAINISALSYIIRRETGSKTSLYHPLLYTFGRALTYILLAWILVCLIGGGRNIDSVQTLLSKGETLLPFLLLAIGAFLIFRGVHHHHHEHGDDCHNSGQIIQRNGPMGAVILGMTLALAFCPESAVFYFGIMLPLASTSSVGLLIPILFAIGASIPVIILAVLMYKAQDKVSRFTHAFEHFQQWVNIAMGVVFAAFAIALQFGAVSI